MPTYRSESITVLNLCSMLQACGGSSEHDLCEVCMVLETGGSGVVFGKIGVTCFGAVSPHFFNRKSSASQPKGAPYGFVSKMFFAPSSFHTLKES